MYDLIRGSLHTHNAPFSGVWDGEPDVSVLGKWLDRNLLGAGGRGVMHSEINFLPFL